MTKKTRCIGVVLAAMALVASGVAIAQNGGSGAGDEGGGGKDGPAGMDIGAIGTKQTADEPAHVARAASHKTPKAAGRSSTATPGGKAGAGGVQ